MKPTVSDKEQAFIKEKMREMVCQGLEGHSVGKITKKLSGYLAECPKCKKEVYVEARQQQPVIHIDTYPSLDGQWEFEKAGTHPVITDDPVHFNFKYVRGPPKDPPGQTSFPWGPLFGGSGGSDDSGI